MYHVKLKQMNFVLLCLALVPFGAMPLAFSETENRKNLDKEQPDPKKRRKDNGLEKGPFYRGEEKCFLCDLSWILL